ncbi:MAG: hypothetical protein VX699_09950 [Myxococcota bacterium]|nr:hypothetical protein [Myxococcota bacterium]
MSVSNINNQPAALSVPATSTPASAAAASSASSTGFNTVDTFETSGSWSRSDTPITAGWIDKIESPSTPVAEKLTNLLLLPVVLPITVTLDVVLYPVVKLGQAADWVKSKFS